MEKKYTIGIDFGTLSGRAVLVEVANGRVVDSAVRAYTHGVMDTALPDGTVLPDTWALQHPADYLEVLDETLPQLLRSSGVKSEQIIGIGIDFTSSTVLPVKRSGTPLCFLDAYRHDPHAYVKLWKHHGAQQYAEKMEAICRTRGETLLDLYGGKAFSEWSLPKLWQVLEEAPHIYDAMDDWIEAGDWIVWQLCGVRTQSLCSAGYKSLYRKGNGFPSEEFFAALDERLRHVVRDKLSAPVLPVCSRAGGLTEEAASRYGLLPGTAVTVSIIDAHACIPAAGITGPGQVLAIIGTSGCYLTMDEQMNAIPGIIGAAEDGSLPGYWGYEAGQSCVGEHFSWFVENGVPEAYTQEAKKRQISVHEYLSDLAQKQAPGEHGLIALDWWNGNRSILLDSDLSGMIVGMTLHTKPEDIYRALVEATAYGAKIVLDNYKKHNLKVESLYVSGGICQKNPMFARIYADVLNLPIHIVSAKEGSALGSAIIAAAAAGADRGGYPTVTEAIHAMSAPSETVILPCQAHVPVYQRLFQIYTALHDHFGKHQNELMHALKSIRTRE